VKSFYETLEVSPHASHFVIRAAYRCLAQHHHPDKNPDTEGAGQRLARINEAYAVLSDAAKRLSYDRELAPIERRRERRGRGTVVQPLRGAGDESTGTSRPFGFRPLKPTNQD